MTDIYLIKERLAATDRLPVRFVVRAAFTSEFNARVYAHAVQVDDTRAVLTLEQWNGMTGQYEHELTLGPRSMSDLDIDRQNAERDTP